MVSPLDLNDTICWISNLIEHLSSGRVLDSHVFLRQSQHNRCLALVIVFPCKLLLVQEEHKR